jgi:D-arabinose 1-dehydrogenase-like Zn-dependent alcohol dehydrogenase
MEACGDCHSDALPTDGTHPWLTRPRVPGHGIASCVDAFGAEVTA